MEEQMQRNGISLNYGTLYILCFADDQIGMTQFIAWLLSFNRKAQKEKNKSKYRIQNIHSIS